jgi:hypothetical protein
MLLLDLFAQRSWYRSRARDECCLLSA